MALGSISRSSRPVRLAALISGLAGLTIGVMSWQQVQRERRLGLEDLDRRARVLVHRMLPTARDALSRPDSEVSEALVHRFEGYRRFIGFALFRDGSGPVCSGKAVSDYAQALSGPVAKVLAGPEDLVETIRLEESYLHVLAARIPTAGERTAGVLLAVHDASYLDERATGGLVRAGFWILLLAFLLMTSIVGLTWLVYEDPMRRLAEWMRRVRLDNALDAPPPVLPNTILVSETDRLASSLRAARSGAEAISKVTVRAVKSWTRERLRTHALECLNGAQLVVVSNREPYMHALRGGQPRVIVPASGLVTALDPVLQSCGGVWVAHGAGEGDRLSVDAAGRISVPPGDSRYTLRRVWLSPEEEEGYYYGFSNEGLWPLCHLAHERPVFRTTDWQHYVDCNRRFAEATLEEVASGDAFVLVQDYHLALVPHLLKSARPDLRVGIFWHIPWPNPEAFRICPWRAEILQGLLGADLVGFHLQQHCNNFLDTVDRMMEARLDWDHFAVQLKGHRSLVRPFPISVHGWAERGMETGAVLTGKIERLKDQNGLHGTLIAVGVDRIDYTKGLEERLYAVERFLEKYPRYQGRFTFVELGAPSRTHIPRYRELVTRIESLAERINWRFQKDGWKPIRLLVAHHDPPEVFAFLRMASVCIVSSLHDGMNLVAKEFVAAHDDGDGVLVLSEFAGAARELSEALVINPYSIEDFADALHAACEMEPGERRRRMERMRGIVEERNVYAWAAEYLSELSRSAGPVGAEPRPVASSAGKGG